MDYRNVIEHGDQFYLPNLSIDIVIIGYDDGVLKCLLLKLQDKWILPGGFIRRTESVDAAASSILRERTGLSDPHLKFLEVFGNSNRHFGKEIQKFAREQGLDWHAENWINNRFVTLAYYSLVDINHTQPVLGDIDEDYGWFRFDSLPNMWMDHAPIVAKARERLKEDIKHEHMTFELLPEKFTMPELHQLHQVILEENIDRSRFQKKMLSTNMFERLPTKQRDTPGRNPYQYRVKQA